MPGVATEVSCQGRSMAQWLLGAPYSSKKQGLPAATQAAAWSLIHLLPQSYETPPIALLAT